MKPKYFHVHIECAPGVVVKKVVKIWPSRECRCPTAEMAKETIEKQQNLWMERLQDWAMPKGKVTAWDWGDDEAPPRPSPMQNMTKLSVPSADEGAYVV